jgi:hypothetical protein
MTARTDAKRHGIIRCRKGGETEYQMRGSPQDQQEGVPHVKKAAPAERELLFLQYLAEREGFEPSVRL